ncbi:MAG: biosynthetic peptidoglycan transglycosylase, partial [Deltaproteobacteria bacterium]
GASSITMQMVKNVLLFREKTLARKLQELYLTWHVENTLDKDRIFEIYLNVIEFGPDLYGIGPAAQYYFGKPAKDLNAVEAAFFSTILPDPKGRSAQYCANEITKWTKTKIEHILANELHRKQLTQEEYDKASATPLQFYKTFDSESEEDCLKRVKKAIKNARPTNPLKDREDDAKRDKKPDAKPHKKHKHKDS